MESSYDLRAMFYVVRLRGWARLFAFNRRFSAEELEVAKTEGFSYLGSSVLPMGFQRAVDVAEYFLREIHLACARSLTKTIATEVRLDHATPAQYDITNGES